MKRRHLAMIVVLVVAGATLFGLVLAKSKGPLSSQARAGGNAHAACDTWLNVVSDGPSVSAMDSMVTQSRKAADLDSRYTKLWSDMREYRLFVTSGVTTNTNYVSADCSDLPS